MTRTFLYRLILASLIATAAAMLIALRPAAAATLKTDVIVEGDLVTLGDLFEGAGEIADQPVFRAPDLGVEGELPAAAAIEAATSRSTPPRRRPSGSSGDRSRSTPAPTRPCCAPNSPAGSPPSRKTSPSRWTAPPRWSPPTRPPPLR